MQQISCLICSQIRKLFRWLRRKVGRCKTDERGHETPTSVGVRKANSRFLEPLSAVSATDYQLHGGWIHRNADSEGYLGDLETSDIAMEVRWGGKKLKTISFASVKPKQH